MKKVATFTSFFVYTRTLLEKQKWIRVSTRELINIEGYSDQFIKYQP